MTISELSARSGKSVEDIVNWAMRGAGGPRTATTSGGANGVSTSADGGRRRRSSGSINTRTPAGRAAYDKAVLSTVKEADDSIGAAAIRDAVGGTPLQVRAALNRLIEQGQVKYQGRARATRYSAR